MPNDRPLSALLLQNLRPLRLRLWGARIWDAAVLGIVCGALLSLALQLLAWVWQFPGARDLSALARWQTAAGLPVITAGLGILVATARVPTWRQLTHLIDTRCQLQDRLATAYSFTQAATPLGLRRLQVLDAIEHLTAVAATRVVPRPSLRPLGRGLGCWLVAIVWAAMSPRFSPPLGQVPAAARADAAAIAAAAERLEATLLKDLRRIAELAGAQPSEAAELKRLADQIERQLQQLKDPTVTPAAALATLSEIQAAVTQASAPFATPTLAAPLSKLGEALAAAAILQPAAEALRQGDYLSAADALETLDPQQLNELEQRTVAEPLADVAEDLTAAQQPAWAEVVENLQDGLSQQDDAVATAASRNLAQQLRQQAARQAIHAELMNQVTALAEAKGHSRSGGDNTDRSDQDRETWGRGQAGDPLAEAQTPLDTQRHREQLQGIQGEGPSDRHTEPAENTQVNVQRQYQPQPQDVQRAFEHALREEALPLGHRQTIRRYFNVIRP